MKVLVLSVGSFVPSHAARRLIEDGNTVLELDAREIVRGRLGHSGARFLLNALTSAWSANSRAPLRDERFQAVLYVHEPMRHQLADVAPLDSGLAPMVSASLQAALAFALEHSARFVLASVCGRRSDDLPAIMAAEALVRDFTTDHDLHAGMARLLDVYGPRMPITGDHSVVGELLHAAVAQAEVELVDELDACHWPVHVQDAVDGVVRLIYSAERRLVTFGGATPYRTRDLIATVQHVAHADVRVRMTDEHRLADRRAPEQPLIGEARGLLGWRPRTGLHAGIQDFARHDPRYRRDDAVASDR
jgi:nucleoside-diphosphate-sugar epimerase